MNPVILAAALEGFEIRLANVNAMIADFKARTLAPAKKKAAKNSGIAKAPRKKRVVSDEMRARMAASQRKRWAAVRGE